MIIDRTFKNGTLTISYTTPEGQRKFFETNIARFKSWVYDDDGKFDTWNGRKCSPTYHDKPNKFDMMQFIFELPKPIFKAINELNKPNVYTCDIETAIGDEFPTPDLAKQPITTISLCSPSMNCMVLGWKPLTDEQKNRCREKYLEYLNNVDFFHKVDLPATPVFQYVCFKNEHDMLEYFLKNIVKRCVLLTGWNFLPFDWYYITTRIANYYNDLNIRMASPRGTISYQKIMYDNQLVKIPIPNHVNIFDYMEICQKYDKSIEIKESMKLDWIAKEAIGAQKIKYDGSLKQLYEEDYEKYVYYNGIDSALVQLLDKYMKCLDVLYAYSSMCSVPLNRCLSPVELGTALVFKDFYEHELYIVWEDMMNSAVDFEGAYVKDPIVGKHKWVACNDFASLYPSAITSTNISFENIVGTYANLSYEEVEAYKKDPNYFVALNNVVYKNDKDYAFKRIQIFLKEKRDKHKYFAQHLETQLVTFIDKLIEERENSK